jgi:ribosomal protein S12 methylthiotransferase
MRFHLVSLGCPKNRVDSERILSVMVEAGFSFTDDPAEAQAVIINTCAFIEPAVNESIDCILDFSAEHPHAEIVVAGCLPLRYKGSLKDPLPEVGLVMEPARIPDLPRLLRDRLTEKRVKTAGLTKGGNSLMLGPTKRNDREHLKPIQRTGRILTTPGYAYLRISEGCSRRCRYCTIPSIRGPLRSVEETELEQEAMDLASRGVRELVLVAQDLTAYAKDKHEKNGLVKLLRRISNVEGIEWIRLMYLHPNNVPSNLSEVINEYDNILPYLDIPFQHISNKVLRAMGRPWKGDKIRSLVDRLRHEIPELVLRTTIMVGYPGEEDQDFIELKDFVESYLIEHVGIFMYSPEPGTPAWDLGDPIPHEVKEARAGEIVEIQTRLVEKRNQERIGISLSGLVEGVSEESNLLLQGRAWDQAPEVDGVLYITSGEALPGEIRSVTITESHGPDLFGEL